MITFENDNLKRKDTTHYNRVDMCKLNVHHNELRRSDCKLDWLGNLSQLQIQTNNGYVKTIA